MLTARQMNQMKGTRVLVDDHLRLWLCCPDTVCTGILIGTDLRRASQVWETEPVGPATHRP